MTRIEDLKDMGKDLIIIESIKVLKSQNKSIEEIRTLLQEKFSLTDDKFKEIMKEYNKKCEEDK